jgi:hypothetical protein
VFAIAPLAPRESRTWQVALRVTGHGRMLVQPLITLPVPVGGELPAMRCTAYTVSPLELLQV